MDHRELTDEELFEIESEAVEEELHAQRHIVRSTEDVRRRAEETLRLVDEIHRLRARARVDNAEDSIRELRIAHPTGRTSR